jgi:hypothetical protein
MRGADTLATGINARGHIVGFLSLVRSLATEKKRKAKVNSLREREMLFEGTEFATRPSVFIELILRPKWDMFCEVLRVRVRRPQPALAVHHVQPG